MDHNSFAKVVSTGISNYEYEWENGGINTGFFNEQELRRLSDLQSQVEIAQMSTFKEEFLKTYTGYKNSVSGNIYQKRRSRGIKFMDLRLRSREEREENEEESETNEHGVIRNKIGEREERNEFEKHGEHWGSFERDRTQDNGSEDTDNDEDQG